MSNVYKLIETVKKKKKLKAVAAQIIFWKTIATESFWQIDLYQTEK